MKVFASAIFVHVNFYALLAKLREATISFVVSLYPTVRMEQLGSHYIRVFMKFDIRVFFRKSAEKIQVSLRSDENKGYFT